MAVVAELELLALAVERVVASGGWSHTRTQYANFDMRFEHWLLIEGFQVVSCERVIEYFESMASQLSPETTMYH